MRSRRAVLYRRVALAAGLAASLILVTAAFSPERETAQAGLGEVTIAQGRLSGSPGRDGTITAFKGIPFAAPAVGENRWRAPQPAPGWLGVRAATDFGPSCIQTIVEERKPWTFEFMTHGEIGEDCLSVNVWTPARTTEERLPVFVYIYGGANREGSGRVPVYDGEGLASKGLVAVTFNYRVGVLGFLAHPDLSAEADYGASGNYGLLDQIAAVRWVHANIAAFGGDPARVTIAGQSAGAQGVHNLTASPLAAGLFHRAIAQSGSSINTFRGGRSLSEAEADGTRFSATKGAATMADLRALSWQDVVAPAGPGQAFRFGPVVDGYALPASVGDTFAAGRQNDVPTITGANADEGGASPVPTTVDEFIAGARQRYGDDATEFLQLYPATTDEEAMAARNRAARDQTRVSMALWTAERARTADTEAFTYSWTHTLPGPDAARYGAFHTSEVPYVLNTLFMSARPFTDADHRIADMLSSYWARFAATGNPNGEGLPDWPSTAARPDVTMALGDAPGPMPVASSDAARRFWMARLTR